MRKEAGYKERQGGSRTLPKVSSVGKLKLLYSRPHLQQNTSGCLQEINRTVRWIYTGNYQEELQIACPVFTPLLR